MPAKYSRDEKSHTPQGAQLHSRGRDPRNAREYSPPAAFAGEFVSRTHARKIGIVAWAQLRVSRRLNRAHETDIDTSAQQSQVVYL